MPTIKEWMSLMPILSLTVFIIVSIYRLFIVCPPVCAAQDMRCVDVTMWPQWDEDFRCICAVPGDRIYLKSAPTQGTD